MSKSPTESFSLNSAPSSEYPMRRKVIVLPISKAFVKVPLVPVWRITELAETVAAPLVAISVSGTSTVNKVSRPTPWPKNGLHRFNSAGPRATLPVRSPRSNPPQSSRGPAGYGQCRRTREYSGSPVP